MTHVGIVGASGYSGTELMRLLGTRPDISLTKVMAGTSAGTKVTDLYPALEGVVDLTFEPYDPEQLDGLDVVFVALPSGEAMSVVPQLVNRARLVIDLGGDFRFRKTEVYERFYRRKHMAAELLTEAVYGLPELNEDQIASARLIANPGCYATSAVLPLFPLLKAGIIAAQGIVVDSLSGVSGAGRSASVEMSFAELNENVRAYKVGTHQHIPEMETVLEQATGRPVGLSFVPHLVPLTRGIYTTIYAHLTQPTTDQDVLDAYQAVYDEAPFVRLRRTVPQVRDVTYTNLCDIAFTIDHRTDQLIIISTLDNLIKGAAGQAIQNMNIMLGLPQETGLVGRELQHVQ